MPLRKRSQFLNKATYRKIGSLLSPVKQARIRTLEGPLSRADIAMLAGCTPATVSYVLSGQKKASIQLMARLARVLHVTVDDLIETLEPDNKRGMYVTRG